MQKQKKQQQLQSLLSKEDKKLEKIKEKQALQNWPTTTSATHGSSEMHWVAPKKWNPGKCTLKPCIYSEPSIYCCRREGGIFWNVHSYDDAEREEALQLAADATNYCPDCFKRENGRIHVCAGDFHAAKQAKKLTEALGKTYVPPKRMEITLYADKPVKPIKSKPKASSISKSSGKKKPSIRFTCNRNSGFSSSSSISSDNTSQDDSIDDLFPGGIAQAIDSLDAQDAEQARDDGIAVMANPDFTDASFPDYTPAPDVPSDFNSSVTSISLECMQPDGDTFTNMDDLHFTEEDVETDVSGFLSI